MPSAAPPRISVVMPTYNAEAYISECIQSVLNQTFKDFEFIIIDDGSTDQSLTLIEKFAQIDTRISVISRENRGFLTSLIEGIKLARGKYIARMDADDISLPHRFAAQYTYLEEHNNVVCVGGDIEHIDYKGRIITRINYPRSDPEIQSLLLKGHSTICHPAAMFRKDIYESAGGYLNEFFPAEDLDLWLRLGEQGQLTNLDTILIRYRLLETSISGSKRLEQRRAAERACQDAWRRRKVTGTFEAHKHWRPDTTDRKSLLEFYLKFGWQARNYQQKTTACVYALKGIRASAYDPRPWKLLLSVLRPLKPSS